MRRKSSGTGDGSTTVMGLRMIQCGRQTVQVIQPDGQVRHFVFPLTVADVVNLYPHHYLSHAADGRRGPILPLDTFLDTGTVYVLLPLPRLFPSAAPPAPRLCSCFLHSSSSHDVSGATRIAALKTEIRRHWPSSKISPDDGNPSSSSSSSSQLLPRRYWEPALDIIFEDRVMALPKEAAAATTSERENHKGKTLVSALNFVLRPSSSSATSSSSSSSFP